MSDERQLGRLLRDGMVAEARGVSAGPEFTERVIGRALATGGPTDPQRRPPWQNWVLPAAAAALVALLVGSALIGTKLLHSAGPAAKPSPALSQPTASTPPPSNPTSPAPSSPATASSAPSHQSSAGVAGPAGGPVPAGFRGYDLTWVSDQDGWALGTAPCGNPPCTSILRTTDGGRSWVGIPAPRAFLVQTDTCNSTCDRIGNLRFANSLVGYAYSQDSFFMTTDGGGSWHKQSGYAYGLEVVAGSVLRISARSPVGGDCTPPGCIFGIQRAAIGSDSWQDVSLPAGGRDVGAQLAASGTTVVLATYAHVSGGAQDATSVLFTSRDGGSNWQKVGEPCPQRNGVEVDTTGVTVAPGGGSITVLCQQRVSGVPFTATSTDGVHFAPGAPVPGNQFGGVVGATSASDLFVLQQDRLYRSSDAGQRWAAVGDGPAGGNYIGFESTTVGRVIGGRAGAGPDGTWTTTDGGQSWTYHSFG